MSAPKNKPAPAMPSAPGEASFATWMRSAPTMTDETPAPVTVTLDIQTWMAVLEAAFTNGKSIDAVVSYALNQGLDVGEWGNCEFRMDADDDDEPAGTETNTSEGGTQ